MPNAYTTYETFTKLARATQKELRKTLPVLLRKKGYNPIATKHYIYAEGNIPIALVAHMDIVGNEPPKQLYYDNEKRVIWAGGHILGADDRAGITAILEIIKHTSLRPHIVFTTEEETGGIGAHMLTSIPMPFKDLRYVIELDRQGMQDCVFYDCDNEEFIDYVATFGFVPDWGTFTDISILCPYWGVAGVNLSVGYYHEHTKYEMLNLNELELTISRVQTMLLHNSDKHFKYIPSPYTYKLLHYGEECSFCGKAKKDLSEAELSSRVIALACPDCIKRHKEIKRCHFCQDYFLTNDPNETVCKSCQEDYMYVGGY